MRVPYLAIVGPRDAENGTISLRARGEEKDLGAMKLEAFVEAAAAEYLSRAAVLGVKP